jgi:hypothetical protein
MVDPGNPLTARVAANHVWTRHFGQPLVPTVFDFGRNGQPPTHPELLDWLASELIDSGWSLRHLHRLVVSSATYRLAAEMPAGAVADRNRSIDPDNRFYWRRPTTRMESQVVRDSLLELAGRLDTSLGGPAILPADQASSCRRSLYFFHSNNERNTFLTTFDEAAVAECYRREQSVVPQQSLALANSPLVHEQLERISTQLLEATERAHNREVSVAADAPTAGVTTGVNNDAAVRLARDRTLVRLSFVGLLGRHASPGELERCLAALQAWRSLAAEEDAAPAERERVIASQWVWVLLNHNDFVSIY